MIRSGQFSFATIQVAAADKKFSEIGVIGIHRVFEVLVRALATKFSNLRIIMTGCSSRLIKKNLQRIHFKNKRDLLTYLT